MQRDPAVSGNVDAAPVVQSGVQNGNSIVFGHVDFIQYAKAAGFSTKRDRSLSERHLVVPKSIRADQGCTICIDVERNIVGWPAEHPG